MIRVCFVCLGNICRSPTAEGVMRHLLAEMGLAERVSVDSAGTAAYHSGEPPDRRASAAARERGIELGGVARQFKAGDWERFDYVLAMARDNFDDLKQSARRREHGAKLFLLRSFDPGSPKNAGVPDPYYGGDSGFDEVLDQCEAACRGLIDHLRREHGL
jgi:low molecular weight protein-tyrosine phosphatase